MKRLLRIFAAVTVALFLSVSLPAMSSGVTLGESAVAPSGVQDFEFDSFSADYYLSRDAEGHATLRTVETFVAVFPDFDQNRGMIRAIPNDYDGVPLHTRVESVVDERDADVPYEATDYGDVAELALGTDDYVHGRTTYTITYTQQNVVRAFVDTADDEFYWDTNGTGFAQPFGTVIARVHVDPSIVEFLTGNNACYQGVQGSTDTCEITQEPDDAGALFTASARNLDPGENLTVALGFTLGTFVQVPPEESTGGNSGENFLPERPMLDAAPWWSTLGGILLTALATLASAFTIVWRFITPKSSKGRGIIIPQYTVPKDLNLLESSDLIGRRSAGVSAQIVSFAVRGKLRILDYPVTKSGAKYTLQLLDVSGVDDQERDLLAAVFGGLTIGAVQEVGVIDDTAARAISAVTVDSRRRVLTRGFKKRRKSWIGFALAGGMAVLTIVALGLAIASLEFRSPGGLGYFAFIFTFLAIPLCIGFAWRPAVLTQSGAEHSDYLLGMRDYLQLAEADRFRMLQSPEGAERVRAEGFDIKNPVDKVKLYEKLLPFAVLWGVEREWARELTIEYGDEAPAWYVSQNGFDPVLFSVALNALSTASIARATPPSSSGSSWSGSGGGSFSGGSFGGGFSGGGGGGGGGGGR